MWRGRQSRNGRNGTNALRERDLQAPKTLKDISRSLAKEATRKGEINKHTYFIKIQGFAFYSRDSMLFRNMQLTLYYRSEHPLVAIGFPYRGCLQSDTVCNEYSPGHNCRLWNGGTQGTDATVEGKGRSKVCMKIPFPIAANVSSI